MERKRCVVTDEIQALLTQYQKESKDVKDRSKTRDSLRLLFLLLGQHKFRDFLKHYAASARTVTEASHKTFNEFGIKLLDVQLIHFKSVVNHI